jgi:hypothetical protein
MPHLVKALGDLSLIFAGIVMVVAIFAAIEVAPRFFSENFYGLKLRIQEKLLRRKTIKTLRRQKYRSFN